MAPNQQSHPASGDSSNTTEPILGRNGWLLFAGFLIALAIFSVVRNRDNPKDVTYSKLYEWVITDKIAEITISGQNARFTLKPDEILPKQQGFFHATVPTQDPTLLEQLRAHKVEVTIQTENKNPIGTIALALLPWGLIAGVWIWMSRRAKQFMTGVGAMRGIVKRGKKFESAKETDVSFEDVAGLSSAKRDLAEVVQFLKDPEKFRRVGARIPRGVLLVGPPGTGKTLLARAVAGESGVPFYWMSASEFIELFVGVGAARVRELFEEAKRNAPAIVFIDEIDAVGRTRGAGLGGGHDEREQTLNQLLSEMDGFDRTAQVVVLAATNRPDVLDPALLRPGRFDRRVVVDRPEITARRAMLTVHTRKVPLEKGVDLEALATMTPGFSGADLANLVNEAALAATRRDAQTINQSDFLLAYDKIVLGDPREGKLDSEEKFRVAVHEMGHAVVAYCTPEAEPPKRITIIPRGMALGATMQQPSEDRHLATEAQLNAKLMVLMGGCMAEKELLGSLSSGAEDDLRQATQIAFRMVSQYGMSNRIGPTHHEIRSEHPFLGEKLALESSTSNITLFQVEKEVRHLLVTAQQQAAKIVRQHSAKVQHLVKLLVAKETLEAEDLAQTLAISELGASNAKAS